MGRPLRIEYAGARYHVINRGNYRQSIFAGKGAAAAFERTLDEAAASYGWRIHAYVVMRNHFHLALELGEPNLSDGMKWLQGTWIRRYNRFRGWVGRPFQGRYKSLLVEPGSHFANVCHYIHLNPVRAGVVEPALAANYAWSSLPKFGSGCRPAWLEGSTVLQSAGDLPDTPAGWKHYGAFLEFLATDEPARRDLVAKKISQGWCLGAEEFKARMRRELAQNGASLARERFSGLEPGELRRERQSAWEERLQQLARAAGIELQALPAMQSDPGKLLLAAAMKSSTSVSNRWLAQRLQIGGPALVGPFLFRWRQASTNRTALGKLLSQVLT